MSDFESLPPNFGRYETLSKLGQGAMGRVYAATDPLIERLVAIKTIRADLLAPDERAEFLERFRAEVRAAGRCAHPAIVAIHDFSDDGENPYIVMEYVKGETLHAALRGPDRAARLPRLVAAMLEVLDGLAAAHALGVIHRDIKPGNIMLTPRGRAKITDFGIARLGLSAMTVAGGIIGTPGYMAPEQALGHEVDHRVDVFATAAVLYEILLGGAPFAGATMAETLLRLTASEPANLKGLTGTATGAVLERGLAKNPDARFGSAAEFQAALRAVLAGGAAPPPPPPPPFPPEDATRVMPAPRPAGLDPALIARLRDDLASRIGPIAETVLRRAGASAASPQELIRACVAVLETPEERRAFLALHGQVATPTASPAPDDEAPAPAAPGFAPSEATRAAATEALAFIVGPIARILVRQAATSAANAPAFIDALCEHAAPAERPALRRKLIALF